MRRVISLLTLFNLTVDRLCDSILIFLEIPIHNKYMLLFVYAL